MKIAVLAAAAALGLIVSAPAAAQIKAGIPPKPRVAADAGARVKEADKTERAHRARDAEFARLDADGDGSISPQEYRAAGALQEAAEERLGPTQAPTRTR